MQWQAFHYTALNYSRPVILSNACHSRQRGGPFPLFLSYQCTQRSRDSRLLDAVPSLSLLECSDCAVLEQNSTCAVLNELEIAQADEAFLFVLIDAGRATQ